MAVSRIIGLLIAAIAVLSLAQPAACAADSHALAPNASSNGTVQTAVDVKPNTKHAKKHGGGKRTWKSGRKSNSKRGVSFVQTESLPFVPTATVCSRGCLFTSIQAAVDSIPWNSDPANRSTIYVKAGVYYEYVFIPIVHGYLTMVGDPGKTVITGNRTASDNATATNSAALKSTFDSGETPTTLGTIGSPTFVVEALGFTAIGITFQNTAGRAGGQAPAVRATGDYISFYNCKLSGYQDTLYAQKGLQFYKDCHIRGVVDFVAGQAKARFDNCRLELLGEMGGAFSAQKRRFESEDSGFAFVGGQLTGSGKGYLGRSWGNLSEIFFGNVAMDNVVLPEGWSDFGFPERRSTVNFNEFNNTGPGAATAGRVSWSHRLDYEDAKKYLSLDYIQGKSWIERPYWLPQWTNGWPLGTLTLPSLDWGQLFIAAIFGMN